MALEKENETYQRELPKLMASEGKFVVISGDSIVGIFGTYEDALNVGYDKCGTNPFLVKKIQSVEQAQFFTRDLGIQCPS